MRDDFRHPGSFSLNITPNESNISPITKFHKLFNV